MGFMKKQTKQPAADGDEQNDAHRRFQRRPTQGQPKVTTVTRLDHQQRPSGGNAATAVTAGHPPAADTNTQRSNTQHTTASSSSQSSDVLSVGGENSSNCGSPAAGGAAPPSATAAGAPSPSSCALSASEVVLAAFQARGDSSRICAFGVSSGALSQNSNELSPELATGSGCPNHNTEVKEFTEEDVENMTTTRGVRAFDHQIGHGGFGLVFKGFWNGKDVAVKSFSSDSAGEQQLRTELRHLSILRHPQLIRPIGMCCAPHLKCIVFPLLTPLVDSSSNNFVPLNMSEKLQVCCDVTSVVAYMHSQHKVHRDMKPQNVLLDSQKRGVVIDLGIAKTVGPTNEDEKGNNIAGTPHYVAPEQKVSPKVGEAFSLGHTIAYILAGGFPRSSSSSTDDRNRNSHLKQLLASVEPPSEACDLALQMASPDYSARPRVETALHKLLEITEKHNKRERGDATRASDANDDDDDDDDDDD